MPRELLIPPTRFKTLMPLSSGDRGLGTLVWESEQHTLKYSYPNRPLGSDRATDFTVNGFLNMTYNVPVVGLRVRACLARAYAGAGGAATEPVAILSTVVGQPDPASVPYTLAPLAPQIVQFPQIQAFGNLGQSLYFRVVFTRVAGLNAPQPIDVTFRGALVSSDPI
jgi:hypothetical protein